MSKSFRVFVALAIGIASLAAFGGGIASAAHDCTFTTNGATMSLDDDCTTDETIFVPDGFTLDGNGHTITAVQPDAGAFLGAVVANAGTEMHVTDLTITTDSLTGSAGGDNRLRGVLFDGASGSITHSSVLNINRGASGSQEGNAIEVRNAPFDGTGEAPRVVEVAHNTIDDYQKTGIVANGDVNVDIHHNNVGDSATQENLAANSIQLGFGATGSVVHNLVEGNQWKGTSNWGATAILIFEGGANINVSNNNIRGNSDIGLYILGDDGTYDNNRVFDEGQDHSNSGSDIGVGNWGEGNAVTNNKVKGFDMPYDGTVDEDNKVVGNPTP